MKVKDFMSKDIQFVKADTNVAEVARIMQQHHIGSVPVCDENNNIVGIITDRDIVLRNVACKKDANKTPISDIMSTNVVTITSDTDIYKASRVMSENQIRRIPVVEDNKVVGLVSLGDLAVDKKFDTEAANALTEISKPINNN